MNVGSSYIQAYYNIFSHDVSGTEGLITFTTSAKGDFYNNVLFGNDQIAKAIYLQDNTSIDFENNIVSGFTGSLIFDISSPAILFEDYNILDGVTTGNYT